MIKEFKHGIISFILSQKKTLKVVLWIVITFIILKLLVALGFYTFQYKLLFRSSPLPKAYEFKFEAPFEEIFIQSGKNRINGLLFKSKMQKGLIIYFHGNADNLAKWGLISPEFTQKGFDILIVDYPTFGKSTGSLNQLSLINMGTDVYDYCKKYYDEEKIILYGRSIGSGIASKVASERNPALLFLETPYVSIKKLVDHHAPNYAPTSLVLRFILSNKENIQKVKCPIMIFHGTDDPVIPFNHSKELSAFLKGKDKLVSFEGGNHNNLSSFSKYHEEMERFLATIF